MVVVIYYNPLTMFLHGVHGLFMLHWFLLSFVMLLSPGLVLEIMHMMEDTRKAYPFLALEDALYLEASWIWMLVFMLPRTSCHLAMVLLLLLYRILRWLESCWPCHILLIEPLSIFHNNYYLGELSPYWRLLEVAKDNLFCSSLYSM